MTRLLIQIQRIFEPIRMRNKKEAQLQAWLHENIDSLIDSIGNLEQLSAQLATRLEKVEVIPRSRLLDKVRGAVSANLDQKVLQTLTALKNGHQLVSLGREFPLIKSGLPGPNPSADILALQKESAAYVIVEVKISADTARQAITELSAYGHGLGHRFLGLNSFDAIWLVVSTEYRPTLTESIAYQQLICDRCIVPIKANVEWKDGQIADVQLEIVEIRKLPTVCSTDALFSNQVFDGIASNFAAKLTSPEVALHFISNASTRLGATGFCFQALPSELQKREYQYPYGVYVGTLNPFKLYRKSALLNEFLSSEYLTRDSEEYEHEIFNQVYDSFDVDLTNFQLKWETETDGDAEDDELNFAGIPYDHSLFELSIRETNSQNLMFHSIFDQLRKMHGGESGAEVGGSDFPSMFFPYQGLPTYHENNIAKVRYFGFLHDVVVKLTEIISIHDQDFAEMTLSEIYESPRLLLKLISIGKPPRTQSG